MTKITKAVARKVLATVDAGLIKGVGLPTPGQMCVEAAVCYALGLPHGDQPNCVSPALRRLKICLNDATWSSSAARARGLRKLAILQLGTNKDFDEPDFARRVVKFTISHTLADLFDTFDWGHESAIELRAAGAYSAAYDAAYDAARAAYDAADAAYDAARAAYDAADAAYDAADAVSVGRAASAVSAVSVGRAAYSAASAARAACAAYGVDSVGRVANAARAASAASAASAAYGAAGDKVLQSFADGVADILIEMKVPGVKWLSLLD